MRIVSKEDCINIVGHYQTLVKQNKKEFIENFLVDRYFLCVADHAQYSPKNR
jgi:hypothetical protein